MRRIALHFPRYAKAALALLLAWSFVTGTGFFYLQRWGQAEGEFGPEINPLQPWLLRAHGLGAFLWLIAFGYLLASHIPVGWRARRQRSSGLSLVALLASLALTGYGLYYLAAEGLREAVGWTHLGLGLAFPVVLAVHIVTGKRRS